MMRLTHLSVRVWDVPIRLFHWGVVLLLATSWVTQHYNWMQLHFLSGYTMLTALLFRFVWGLIGSDTARFARFLRHPVAALRHLAALSRRHPDTEIGHNAAGGWMVLVMLLLLAVQVGTGLCANDQISTEGPLAHVVGDDRSDWLSHIHAVNFKLIEVAVALHLLAIVVYRLLGYDLIRPMITGRKRLPSALPAPRLASPRLALLVFLVAAAAVAVFVRALGG
jgi:cytochrome b